MYKIGIFLSENKFIGGAHQYSEVVIDSLRKFDKSKFQIYAIVQNVAWLKILPNRFKKIIVQENNFTKLLSTIYNYFDINGYGNKIINHLIYKKIKIINSQNFDLIIFPAQNRESYLVKCKTLVTVHDLMHRYEGQFQEFDKNEFNRRERKYKQISKNATAILVDSKMGKKHLIESYNTKGSKIHILPFVSKNFDKIKMNNKLKLPKKFLFYPAQFWEHKNHINLIKALKILNNEFKNNVNLILTGSKKNYYYEVISLIKELKLTKKIHILNYVDDRTIKTLYKKAQCLAFVSFCGPTNIPPLESIKLNCPVVCSDVYGMREQLNNSAIFVNPKDPRDIAKKINSLIKNKSKKNKLIKKGSRLDSKNNLFTFKANLVSSVNKVLKL